MIEPTGIAAIIGAIFTGLTGLIAGVAAFAGLRRRRADQDYADLKTENAELKAQLRKLRAYVDVLYAYAVKLFRWLVREGHTPDRVPEEEDATP